MSAYAYDIRPSGQMVRLADMPTAAPNAVEHGTTASEPDATGALCLPCRVERHPELTALARALKIPAQAVSPWGPDLERLARVLSQPALDGAQIEFRLQRFTRSAPLMRHAGRIVPGAGARARRAAGKNPVMRAWLEEKLRALGPWYAAAAGVRLRSRLTAQAEIPPVVLDLVSRCLYGSPLARENEEETLYLADAWPGIDLAFLEALPAILERHRTAKARRERAASPAAATAATSASPSSGPRQVRRSRCAPAAAACAASTAACGPRTRRGASSCTIADEARVTRYRFGTKTADFHVCATCGVVPIVTCVLDGRRYAVVNANTFDDVDRSRVERRRRPTSRARRRRTGWPGASATGRRRQPSRWRTRRRQ